MTQRYEEINTLRLSSKPLAVVVIATDFEGMSTSQLLSWRNQV